jgi:hypothetical protein
MVDDGEHRSDILAILHRLENPMPNVNKLASLTDIAERAEVDRGRDLPKPLNDPGVQVAPPLG